MTDQVSHDVTPPDASLSTVRLEELFATVRRHAALVAGVTASVVAAVALVAHVRGPVYRAVAVIRLSDPRRALTGGVVEDPALSTDERFADPLLSQVQLLTSRGVAGAVVDSMPVLRLRPTRGLPPSLLGEVAVPPAAGPDSFGVSCGADTFVVRGTFGRRSAPYGSPVDAGGGIRFAILRRPAASEGHLRVLGREAAITGLLKDLRVKPRIRTDIVDVEYSAAEPQFAERIVNEVVDIFRSTSAAAAQEQSRRRREFLETQLRVNDSLLADARAALMAFRQRAGAYGSREALTREQIGLAGVELQREQLEAERRTDQDLLASLGDSSVDPKPLQTALATPGVAASPAVTQLSTQLFQYDRTRDSLASRSPTHPDLPRIRQLIASTEGNLVRAVQASMRSSIASLDARIAAMNELRTRQRQLGTTEAEEARLTERVDNAEKVADELRVEYQKAGIAEAVTVGQVEIVDHASLPARPAGIGLAQQLTLGLLLGVMLGAGGAVVADRLGGSITRRIQVEHLGMPVLGVVPRCAGDPDKKGPKSSDALVEALRGIRLNLLNVCGGADPLVVAVTSPGSGDGKSFVSSNLALAFAYADHHTLLIDADLRRGALHRVLGVHRHPGLTDLLVGDTSREQTVQPTTHPHLDFIGSGSRRRDAPELIGSARMTGLMTDLRSHYGVIVVDTPPLGAGVDAFLLATLAGNLLVVLRLGRTERELAEAKLELLRSLPPRLLGAILNDVREGSEYHAYRYYLDGYELSDQPLFQPLVSGRKGVAPPVAVR